MVKRKGISLFATIVLTLLMGLLAAACVPKLGFLQQALATATSAPVPNTGAALSVTVNDQELQDNKVVVADTVSSGPGWIAIHTQQNGSVGPVIAVAPVHDGDNKNVTVTVDPDKTTPVMYAMLHVDGGEVGKYEFPGPDIPAVMNGQMITPSFKVLTHGEASTDTPQVSVEDQPIEDGRVKIDKVVSKGPGWVAIHVQNPDGTPGTDIGFTAVKAGENKDVVVIVDPKRVTPVMYAMLHQDLGEIGTYEYPGADTPVEVNGAMLAPSFHVTNAEANGSSQPDETATPAAQAGMPGMETGPTATAGATANASSATPLVKVANQAVNEGMVNVDEVVSSGPGWVVIYTTGSDGQADQFIGRAQVKDGDNRNVMVHVDPSKASGSLIAMLHTDGGTVGTFEYPGPDMPVLSGIKIVSGKFDVQDAAAAAQPTATKQVAQAAQPTATTAPAAQPTNPSAAGQTTPDIKVADQPIVNNSVKIAEVDSDEPAWVVIHRQNGDGTMGEMVGFAHINKGVNQNVTVPVDTNSTSSTMYAMLHKDVAKASSPQFPGVDEPIMVNNQMIAPTFSVLAPGDVALNVSTAQGTSPHLVDGRGMSLYLFLNDVPGKSNCTGGCLDTWKPVTVNGRISPGPGVDASRVGVLLLPNGRQVTYSGAPLYTYAGDKNPGDTNGQGVNGLWFLVTP